MKISPPLMCSKTCRWRRLARRLAHMRRGVLGLAGRLQMCTVAFSVKVCMCRCDVAFGGFGRPCHAEVEFARHAPTSHGSFFLAAGCYPLVGISHCQSTRRADTRAATQRGQPRGCAVSRWQREVGGESPLLPAPPFESFRELWFEAPRAAVCVCVYVSASVSISVYVVSVSVSCLQAGSVRARIPRAGALPAGLASASPREA